jgi:putative transposase
MQSGRLPNCRRALNIELFASLQEAKLLAEQHRIEYIVYSPNSALQGRTPLEVLQQWKAA